MSWICSLVTNSNAKPEGKGTHICGPFRSASQGQSRVEEPTENNQHILFTHQRCICDEEQTGHQSSARTNSFSSSLLQTHPPIFWTTYLCCCEQPFWTTYFFYWPSLNIDMAFTLSGIDLAHISRLCLLLLFLDLELFYLQGAVYIYHSHLLLVGVYGLTGRVSGVPCCTCSHSNNFELNSIGIGDGNC